VIESSSNNAFSLSLWITYSSNAASMNQTLKKAKNMIFTTTKEQIKAQKTIKMNK